jgi:hypothetical protein
LEIKHKALNNRKEYKRTSETVETTPEISTEIQTPVPISITPHNMSYTNPNYLYAEATVAAQHATCTMRAGAKRTEPVDAITVELPRGTLIGIGIAEGSDYTFAEFALLDVHLSTTCGNTPLSLSGDAYLHLRFHRNDRQVWNFFPPPDTTTIRFPDTVDTNAEDAKAASATGTHNADHLDVSVDASQPHPTSTQLGACLDEPCSPPLLFGTLQSELPLAQDKPHIAQIDPQLTRDDRRPMQNDSQAMQDDPRHTHHLDDHSNFRKEGDGRNGHKVMEESDLEKYEVSTPPSNELRDVDEPQVNSRYPELTKDRDAERTDDRTIPRHSVHQSRHACGILPPLKLSSTERMTSVHEPSECRVSSLNAPTVYAPSRCALLIHTPPQHEPSSTEHPCSGSQQSLSERAPPHHARLECEHKPLSLEYLHSGSSLLEPPSTCLQDKLSPPPSPYNLSKRHPTLSTILECSPDGLNSTTFMNM